MDSIQGAVGISFWELERAIFGRFLGVMAEGTAEILQAIDGRITEEPDKQRCEIKGRVSRTVETLVGPVEFGRRYYWDRVANQRVFLLDEMLSLPEGQRVAPGLGALVAMLGVQGPFLRLGERVERDDEAARDEPDGKRQAPVLFVEADGLVAFWEEASRKLYSIYGIDEKTWVVINGDRAGWIREGVKYFPRAIYQIDRYHLKRDLRNLLRGTPQLRRALKALEDNQAEELLAALAVAEKECPDEKRQAAIRALKEDLMTMPEACRDYRVRLQEMGISAEGMRGLGAAESNMDRFANRVKKRGQSWSRRGLQAITQSLARQFEGRLEQVARRLTETTLDGVEARLRAGAGQLAREVANAYRFKQARLPVRSAGRGASGGLSRLFRKLTLPA